MRDENQQLVSKLCGALTRCLAAELVKSVIGKGTFRELHMYTLHSALLSIIYYCTKFITGGQRDVNGSKLLNFDLKAQKAVSLEVEPYYRQPWHIIS